MNYNEKIYISINNNEPEFYIYGKSIKEGKLNIVEKTINLAIESHNKNSCHRIEKIEFIVNSWKRE